MNELKKKYNEKKNTNKWWLTKLCKILKKKHLNFFFYYF